jgi:hypothetical protein
VIEVPSPQGHKDNVHEGFIPLSHIHDPSLVTTSHAPTHLLLHFFSRAEMMLGENGGDFRLLEDCIEVERDIGCLPIYWRFEMRTAQVPSLTFGFQNS